MAERRDFNYAMNFRIINRRYIPGANLIEIYSASYVLTEFLESKKNELRKLTNDQTKTPYNSAILEAQMKLDKKIRISSRAGDFFSPEKIMNMISDFKFMVTTLLNSNGNIILGKRFNYTLFDAAVATGYKDIVTTFFNYGLKINSMYNTPFNRHCVALHRAAQSKQENMVNLLIYYGADVNKKDFHNKTALFYAIQAKHLNITLILLNSQAKIDDPDILTAGILSVSISVVRLLLERGAHVNKRDLCGRVPLHFVSTSKKLFIDHDFDRAQIARAIIESGAFVNAKTKGGITPLHAAALKGYYQVAEALLTNGAEVDEFVSIHRTALFYASYNTHPEVVKLLLMYGANINILDSEGKSALDMANDSGRGKYAMVCNKSKLKVDIKLKSDFLLQMEANESDFDDDDDSNHVNHMNYLNSYINSRNKTIRILQQHIIKMITAGMFVRKDIKSKVNTSEMESFQTMCHNELKMMKTIPIVNHLTGFDIIRMSLTELTSYTSNPDIRDVLRRYHYSTLFPLYGIIIHAQIQRAIRTQRKCSHTYDLFKPSLNLPGCRTHCYSNATKQ